MFYAHIQLSNFILDPEGAFTSQAMYHSGWGSQCASQVVEITPSLGWSRHVNTVCTPGLGQDFQKPHGRSSHNPVRESCTLMAHQAACLGACPLPVLTTLHRRPLCARLAPRAPAPDRLPMGYVPTAARVTVCW